MIPLQIATIMRRIYDLRLTTTSGGNISARDDEGTIWITPAAVDKGTMQASDIVTVHPDGRISGNHKPSSEFPFHNSIYDACPHVRAILHAHSPALVAFSIAHEIPDPGVLIHTRNICRRIGFAAYQVPGSALLGETLAHGFRNGNHALILENHGVVVVGADVQEAYDRFESLEFCAEVILNSRALGELSARQDDQPLRTESPELKIQETQTSGAMSHPARPEDLTSEPSASDAISHPAKLELLTPDPSASTAISHAARMKYRTSESVDPRETSKEIIRFVHRALKQGLMQGSFGTISVRTNNNDFRIVPDAVSRWDLTPKEIIEVKDDFFKRNPFNSQCALYREIYKQHDHIRAIIRTQTPGLMAFAVTKTKPEMRTIPETVMFLGEIPLVSFDEPTRDPEGFAGIFTHSNAILIANDSVIVTGNSLLQAFDRLEIAEFTARSVLSAKMLGRYFPLTEQQINELGTL